MSRRNSNIPRPFMLARILSSQEKESLRLELSVSQSSLTWLPIKFKTRHMADTLVDSHLVPFLAYFQPFNLMTDLEAKPPVCSLGFLDPLVVELWNDLRASSGRSPLSERQSVVLRLNRLVKFFGSRDASMLAQLGLVPILDPFYLGRQRFHDLDPAVQSVILDALEKLPAICYLNGNVLDNRYNNLSLQQTSDSRKRSLRRESWKERQQQAASMVASAPETDTRLPNFPAQEAFEPMPEQSATFEPDLSNERDPALAPSSTSSTEIVEEIMNNFAETSNERYSWPEPVELSVEQKEKLASIQIRPLLDRVKPASKQEQEPKQAEAESNVEVISKPDNDPPPVL